MRQGKIVRRIIHYPAPERTAPPEHFPYYYPEVKGSDAYALSGVLDKMEAKKRCKPYVVRL